MQGKGVEGQDYASMYSTFMTTTVNVFYYSKMLTASKYLKLHKL